MTSGIIPMRGLLRGFYSNRGLSLCLIAVLTGLLVLSGTAYSGIGETGEHVGTSRGDTLAENFIGAGETVDIRGVLLGDLIAAARSIEIDDSIEGNIYAAARSIYLKGNTGGDALMFCQDMEILGNVGSDMRGACEDFVLEGHVGRDLMMGARTVTITRDASVENDVFIGAEVLRMNGRIGRKLLAGVERLEISGVVEGDVEVWAETVEIRGDGRIMGDLVYHAEKPYPDEANWADAVEGEIIFKAFTPEEMEEASEWPGLIWTLLAALITAVVMIALFKGHLKTTLENFIEKPLPTIGIGALGLIVTPIVSVLLMVLVIALPLGLMLLALYVSFLYLGWVLFAVIGGTWLWAVLRKGDTNVWLGGLLGVFVLWLIALIPFLGALVCIFATIAGMGMLMTGVYGVFRPNKMIAAGLETAE
ncbi:hypothetical protein GF324_10130 [bacterium]|nr:hypothetical protein [bacterium]